MNTSNLLHFQGVVPGRGKPSRHFFLLGLGVVLALICGRPADAQSAMNCAAPVTSAPTAEWGVHVNHTTIMRRVHRYVPEYEERWNRRAKPVGPSWRMDETFIQTRPKMGYLYRPIGLQR